MTQSSSKNPRSRTSTPSGRLRDFKNAASSTRTPHGANITAFGTPGLERKLVAEERDAGQDRIAFVTASDKDMYSHVSLHKLARLLGRSAGRSRRGGVGFSLPELGPVLMLLTLGIAAAMVWRDILVGR